MKRHEQITLAHGNGGRRTRALIDDVFSRALGDIGPDTALDAAPIRIDGPKWAMSVDGFTVDPIEFPGGDVGALAAHGTLNDLAVAGADPRYLSFSAILEEGLALDVLERLATSFAAACRDAGVRVVAGDTKVVPRGHGGGAYFTTTGIGERVRDDLDPRAAREGDLVLVSGPIGDHGIAVMFAREDFEMRGDLASDCGSVVSLCRDAWTIPGVRFLRDPTRGGLATVAGEIARSGGHDVLLEEERVPVRPPVSAVCEMLGFDPYYLACEGRVVAVVAPDDAEGLLARWRARSEGAGAAIVGAVGRAGAGDVLLRTELGGTRFLPELDGDPLPRIC